MLRIDHVILGVRDLEEAGERLLRDHGLASLPGGRHESWGTGNRIVPLGPDYLELMAVLDAETARKSEFGRTVQNAVSKGDRFIGWCLRTDDLESVASRLGLPVERGSRTLPGGEVLRWRLAGRNAATPQAWLPFFIAWDVPDERHPGQDRVAHAAWPQGIAWVEVAGDADRLIEWLGGAAIPVRVIDGTPGVHAVGVSVAGGELVIRARSLEGAG